MAERHTLPGKMMPADAGFHANQAGRQIGETVGKLPARPFLPQHDRAALVEANRVECILADVDADHGDLGQCIAGHGRAPSKAPLIQRASLVGQEHGRTIPLAEVKISSIKQLAAKKADVRRGRLSCDATPFPDTHTAVLALPYGYLVPEDTCTYA
jgi:hypothetical protein